MKDSNMLATSEGEIGGKDDESVVLNWHVAKGKSSSQCIVELSGKNFCMLLGSISSTD